MFKMQADLLVRRTIQECKIKIRKAKRLKTMINYVNLKPNKDYSNIKADVLEDHI